MDKFIIKMFGINKVNFWGWFIAEMMLLGVAVIFLIYSYDLVKQNILKAQYSVLVSIALLLMGQFALSLQKYHAKLAEKIERQNKNKG